MRILFIAALSCFATLSRGQLLSVNTLNTRLNTETKASASELSNDNTSVILDSLSPKLITLLYGVRPKDLPEVRHAVEQRKVLYDPGYHHKLFGFVPREVLLLNSKEKQDHIQINFEFPKDKETQNGYKPMLEMVENLTNQFGKPAVKWWQSQMSFTWNNNGVRLVLTQIEIKEQPLIILRMDIQG